MNIEKIVEILHHYPIDIKDRMVMLLLVDLDVEILPQKRVGALLGLHRFYAATYRFMLLKEPKSQRAISLHGR